MLDELKHRPEVHITGNCITYVSHTQFHKIQRCILVFWNTTWTASRTPKRPGTHSLGHFLELLNSSIASELSNNILRLSKSSPLPKSSSSLRIFESNTSILQEIPISLAHIQSQHQQAPHNIKSKTYLKTIPPQQPQPNQWPLTNTLPTPCLLSQNTNQLSPSSSQLFLLALINGDARELREFLGCRIRRDFRRLERRTYSLGRVAFCCAGGLKRLDEVAGKEKIFILKCFKD